MAYVPNCKCDVFVSFAHLDDEAIGNRPPWVSSFASDLKKVLRMRLGVREEEGLKVYFTGHGEPRDRRRPRIRADEERRLVGDLRRRHLAGLCRRRFLDDARARRLPEGDGRRRAASSPSSIRRSTRSEEYPPTLRDLKRMAFWQKHPEREIPVTMASGSDVYLQTLFDLAEQIRRQLKKMREAQAPTPAPAPTRQGRARRAPPVRRQIRRRAHDLSRAGHRRSRRGARAGPPLCRAVRHQSAADRATTRRAASISPARWTPISRAPTHLRAAPRPHERQAAARHAARLRPAAVRAWRWRAGFRSCSGSGPTSTSRRASPIAQHAGAALRRACACAIGLEAFKAEVLRKRARQAAAADAGPVEQFIFINADGSDFELAEILRRELVENAHRARRFRSCRDRRKTCGSTSRRTSSTATRSSWSMARPTPVWVRGAAPPLFAS